MGNIKEKLTFCLSALLYLVFNLRLGANITSTLEETFTQIVMTAPYVIGATFVVISFLHYASGGEKIPWDRIFRVFFTLGIMVGLYNGILEYAGQGTFPGK